MTNPTDLAIRLIITEASKGTKMSAYLTLPAGDGGTVCWPDPADPLEAQWTARYAPDQLSREQTLWLASVAAAYAHVIALPARTRQKRVAAIRDGRDYES